MENLSGVILPQNQLFWSNNRLKSQLIRRNNRLRIKSRGTKKKISHTRSKWNLWYIDQNFVRYCLSQR